MRDHSKPNLDRNGKRIFVLNELSLRLSPVLANEIGLNESIMLLQIEFWISVAPDTNIIDGRKWTFQSVRQMQEKAFTFWSTSTINRTANSLIDMGLILEGNYNKHSYDKTRWFALNYENLSKLNSIAVSNFSETGLSQFVTGHDTGVFQNVTGSTQIVTGVFQNVTTIPEITPENTTENINTTATATAEENGDRENFDSESETTSQIEEQNIPSNYSIGDRAINFAEENFQDKLKPFEKNQIREWCLEFQIHGSRDPDELVITGLKRCVMMKNYTLAYLEPIISDYLRNNVTTVEQTNKLKDQFKASGKRSKSIETKKVNMTEQTKSDKYEKFYL